MQTDALLPTPASPALAEVLLKITEADLHGAISVDEAIAVAIANQARRKRERQNRRRGRGGR